MTKKIAVVTGASGGIGKEFVRLLLNENIDEIWAIARNKQKLDLLKKDFGDKIIPVSEDIADIQSVKNIEEMLKSEKPVVEYLINNAGMAKMGSYNDFSVEEIDKTVRLNCSTPVMLSTICIPYMKPGSKILNISSASAFQPLPFLNLYSASKVFERSYSRALNTELKDMGITVTAVCPSWVDTDLLMKEANGKKIKFKGIITPEQAAKKALKDAKRGKDMSVCTLRTKTEHLLAKLYPQKLSMKIWLLRIQKYI